MEKVSAGPMTTTTTSNTNFSFFYGNLVAEMRNERLSFRENLCESGKTGEGAFADGHSLGEERD